MPIERTELLPVAPVAYLHTLHMEGGQTYERLTMHNGLYPDDARVTAFGIPGRDYSEEYSVSTVPLYASQSHSGEDVAPIERTAEQERAAIVAWLREKWGMLPEALDFADAIERGDHIEHSGRLTMAESSEAMMVMARRCAAKYWQTGEPSDEAAARSTLSGEWDDHAYTQAALAALNARQSSEGERDRAIGDIAAERQRQIEAEGWTPEHDDEHGDAQMAGAAACYAMSAIPHWAKLEAIRLLWPWSKSWWKPRSHRENLVRAGALILAEIERIDRAALRATDNAGGS